MVNFTSLNKALLAVILSSALVACESSDDEEEGTLTCTPPQQINSAGTACETPDQPVDNNAPVITSGSSATVGETAENGTLVYSATATDADGDTLTWSLSGDTSNIFSIDTSSGELDVADTANLSADLSPYSVTISVSDGEDSVSVSVAITIEADDSAPMPTVVPGDNQAVIYYLRDDNTYTGWTIHAWNNASCDGYAQFAADGGTEWTAGLEPTGTDPVYGAYWLVDTNAGSDCLNYILHSGDTKDPNDDDQSLSLTGERMAFIVAGDAIYNDYTAIGGSGGGNSGNADPSVDPSASEGVVYYYRADGNYTGWTLHAWNDATCNGYADFAEPDQAGAGTEWNAGLAPTGTDDNFGAYWLFDTKAGATCANFIIHNGDEKDPNDIDNKLDLTGDRWVFAVSGDDLYTNPNDVDTSAAPFSIADSAAHWIDETTFVWNRSATDVRLVFSSTASLGSDIVVTDNNSIALTTTTLSQAQIDRVPHLADWNAYAIDTDNVKALLKQQLVLASVENDEVVAASFVQYAKVLDDVYTSGDADADEATLGLVYDNGGLTLSVWAPTATDVDLLVYDDTSSTAQTLEMTEDAATGIWSYATDDASTLDRKYYRFNVSVYHPATEKNEVLWATDPYSVNASTNGRYSQFVNLADDDLKPAGWDNRTIPTIDNVEDAILLEAHIRDFSAQDLTTTEANRGKYLAFTESNSDAMSYLTRLANAGVTHFHMLPANDIATIKEENTFNINDTVETACGIASNLSICGTASNTDTIRDVLESYDPSTLDAAKLVNEIRGYDSFNWGYDPHHFNVVEGSYASDAEGVARIIEFRQMVQSIQEAGMRVVLDVVYNHTSASKVYDNSVFDKVVPGYYHRYKEVSGEIENSTCCDNTATEHKMMDKFVIDSLVHWAKFYGMDGFRFDVMGHMPKQNILDGRDAVLAIDPDNYFYGEGWNWGEVVNNRLFEQATQYNLAGTKVGTFNDRPRDSIRRAELSKTNPSAQEADHIRLGLAGTLQNYVLEDQNGTKKLGKNFGQSSYGLTPADAINYVSKHDNETLWDYLQYGIESGTSSSDRVRIHNLSAAIPVMSQGIPFFQLGIDKMRSKSMHRNTYDFGDWYNYVDYTNTTNNWNVGLPTPTEYGYDFNGNQTDTGHGEGWKWPLIGGLSADTDIVVGSSDINFSEAVFEEFLTIRSTSPLFRLTTEQDVINRVGFHNTGANQTGGLIVMSIDDGTGLTDLDPNYDAIVVVINGSASEVAHTVTKASGFTLHTVQANGADSTVQGSSFAEDSTSGTFTVPAYSVAVFVKDQGASQGEGLNPDPDFIASPYNDTDIYLRGLDDDTWGTDRLLSYDGRGTYAVSTTLAAGSYEFKVANSDYSSVNLGFAEVDVDGDSVAITAVNDNENMAITLDTSGTYLFELNVLGNTPVIKATLTNALVTCADPVSAGAAPFSIFGGSDLYIRGDHSGWNADEAYRMTYIGSNQYQAVATFDGAFQFKLASDDGSWTTQLWAQNADGSINSSNLEVGTNYDIAYDDAGSSNNAMDLAQGDYRFTLTLNEDDPAKGTKPAGSLIVEQCDN